MSKNLMPTKAKLFVDVSGSKVVTKTIHVPKFGLKTFMSKEGEPVFGTEILFEGELFYPVVYGQKTASGWGVPGSDFVTKDDILFWDEELNEEFPEVYYSRKFMELDSVRWKYFVFELHKQSLDAIKLCFAQFVLGGKVE